jgi:hypothetical protein
MTVPSLQRPDLRRVSRLKDTFWTRPTVPNGPDFCTSGLPTGSRFRTSVENWCANTDFGKFGQISNHLDVVARHRDATFGAEQVEQQANALTSVHVGEDGEVVRKGSS